MALSAFDDKSRRPTEAELADVLGSTYGLWNELKHLVSGHLESENEVWGYGSKSTGWGLRIKEGERVILYMTPREGDFLVSFALGGKAVAAARQSTLPASVISIIDSSKRYAEGTGVRLEIRSAGDVRNAVTLALIKSAN